MGGGGGRERRRGPCPQPTICTGTPSNGRTREAAGLPLDTYIFDMNCILSLWGVTLFSGPSESLSFFVACMAAEGVLALQRINVSKNIFRQTSGRSGSGRKRNRKGKEFVRQSQRVNPRANCTSHKMHYLKINNHGSLQSSFVIRIRSGLPGFNLSTFGALNVCKGGCSFQIVAGR